MYDKLKYISWSIASNKTIIKTGIIHGIQNKLMINYIRYCYRKHDWNYSSSSISLNTVTTGS